MGFGRLAIGAVAVAAVAACAPHEHEQARPKLNKAGATSTGSSGVSGVQGSSGGTGTSGGWGGSSGSTGATSASLCASCTRDADCGPGGCCVLDGVAGAFCTAPCGSGESCPSGQTCYEVGGSGETGCYPSSLTCTAGGSGSACTSDTWSGYADDFFEHTCQSCHGWTGSHEEVQESAPELARRIQSGEMPPGGGLSASEIDRIVKYLNCGAP